MENEPEEKLGSALCEEDKKYVLSAYVHRFTKDHMPDLAKELRIDGTKYPVQFSSDNDWLNNTYFAVNKDGRLDKRFKYCRSNPTWPEGK